MTPIKFIPVNQTWAGETPNKLELGDTEIGQGIVFQSNIVSNQLNSAFNILSENLRYHQCAGGFYLPNMRYYQGHIVALNVIINPKYGVGIRYFQCINDNNGQGIVNVHPYTNIVQQTDGNGLITYTANNVNTAYWSECVGVSKELNDQVQEAISDKWKDLGSVSGSFNNFNFGGTNNNYNNFFLTLTANTNFGALASVTSARERSGMFVIKAGGKFLQRFFTGSVVYYSFNVPFTVVPEGSNNGAMLMLPYKVIPSLNKVVFTRC
ncbi:TPA: hypothetical protein RTG57_001716 [Campylobacter jejuni]|nr:hypothetical protein [Campylobacter jejuni]HDZ5057788.1 hypothetical protein [Campylobacter jejuni]